MDNNQKHIEKIYVDKAINLLKICIGIFAFSGLTYVIPLFLYNIFDFGLIFEIISFIFTISAISNLELKKLQIAKRNTIIAMLPIGWLIVYDFMNLLANLKEVLYEIFSYFYSLDYLFYYLEPYLFDTTLFILLILLFKVHSSICKADGTKKSDNYIDNFYDNL